LSVFFDTNILFYASDPSTAEAPIAERLILSGGFISVQVLNELADSVRRKLNMPWYEIIEWREALLQTCEVLPLTEITQRKALGIANRYNIRIYDANIWAAAILAGCETLYSEDMHHGLTIEGTTLHNPFRG
jgi:predicted nucleic acid-binding protein